MMNQWKSRNNLTLTALKKGGYEEMWNTAQGKGEECEKYLILKAEYHNI